MPDKYDDLDDLFAAARAGATPSEDLIAQVLADAEAVQAENAAPSLPPRPRQPRWFPAMLGGWRVAGGLIAAAVTGVSIGFLAPDSIDGVLGGQLSQLGLISSDDLVPGLGTFLEFEEG